MLQPADKVKDWYVSAFPTDELGEEINPNLSFEQLWNEMKEEKKDFYQLIGVYDSFVRENIFVVMTEVLGVSYDTIYRTWLASERT